MNIELIATDLDGTLLSADHLTVSPRTKEALQKAHDMGVKIAIATGRTLAIILNVVEQIPFVDYVIYSNGASVYDVKQKRDIYRNHIPADSTEELLKFLRGEMLYYIAYIDGKMYVQNDRMQFYRDDGNLPMKFIEDYMKKAVIVDDIVKATIGMSAEIVAAFSVGDKKDRVAKFMSDYNLSVVSSLPDEIEGTIYGADKGKALDGICAQMGISPQAVMAFGDAGNDCPMLEYAGYSFAMENATDECKKCAEYSAASNVDDGVAKAIEQYVINCN